MCIALCTNLRGGPYVTDRMSRRSTSYPLSFPRMLSEYCVIYFFSSCILWPFCRIFDVGLDEAR